MTIVEKLLPIGSVVLLKGGTKRLMVTGYAAYDKGDTSKLYDYSACLYPEGIIESDQLGLFDAEQIEKVFHVGLSDDEEKAFKKALSDELSKMAKEQAAKTASQPAAQPTAQPVAQPAAPVGGQVNLDLE